MQTSESEVRIAAEKNAANDFLNSPNWAVYWCPSTVIRSTPLNDPVVEDLELSAFLLIVVQRILSLVTVR